MVIVINIRRDGFVFNMRGDCYIFDIRGDGPPVENPDFIGARLYGFFINYNDTMNMIRHYYPFI